MTRQEVWASACDGVLLSVFDVPHNRHHGRCESPKDGLLENNFSLQTGGELHVHDYLFQIPDSYLCLCLNPLPSQKKKLPQKPRGCECDY